MFHIQLSRCYFEHLPASRLPDGRQVRLVCQLFLCPNFDVLLAAPIPQTCLPIGRIETPDSISSYRRKEKGNTDYLFKGLIYDRLSILPVFLLFFIIFLFNER